MREWLGVWIKDRWRYERALRGRGYRYLELANRSELLSPAPDGIGVKCCWEFTSQLHAPSVHRNLAQRLLQRCLIDAPIERANQSLAISDHPAISVLIGHRGLERLPLLLSTLQSIAAQAEIAFECIVIEQDSEPQVSHYLPAWVRYLHSPPVEAGAPYNRSRAFNVGAKHAKAPLLLLHDNDMLVPRHYLRRIFEKSNCGYHVINPKRFVFYLSERHTAAVLDGSASFDEYPAESIVQNLEAGGSMAISNSAFWEIGGMDECFVGWGGEDNELWDRCQSLPCWIWGYDPIVHLWHPSQPLKGVSGNPNLLRAQQRMNISRQERISQLRASLPL